MDTKAEKEDLSQIGSDPNYILSKKHNTVPPDISAAPLLMRVSRCAEGYEIDSSATSCRLEKECVWAETPFLELHGREYF